jgi:hypothetical protein
MRLLPLPFMRSIVSLAPDSQLVKEQNLSAHVLSPVSFGSAEGLVDLRVYAASVAAGFMMSSNSTGVSFPSLR